MNKWLYLVLLLTSLVVQADPLPAKEVFQMHLSTAPNTLIIHWDIKPGYFLYKDRIALHPIAKSNLAFPEALKKVNAEGLVDAVYTNKLTLPVAIAAQPAGETLLQLTYQGCSQSGFCYPPEKNIIKLLCNDHGELIQATLVNATRNSSRPNDTLSMLFAEHQWPVILVIFFGFGLLLSFTPCILPMIPVLSGIIVGHGKAITTKKAFLLSLSYVLSMSFTYALIGAVVALLGANIQASMQSPWSISLLSLLFLLLALSMFGWYEFKLPQAWQAKIAGNARNPRGGHYWGAAIMGCLSTLILSPCVTAPLVGVLTYIAQTGNILFGSLTLFILSLGMGTPLLLIGTSAGKWLPETGPWMNTVKSFLGVLLLAVALYLMGRILPSIITMGLWAVLLLFVGIYAGALTAAHTPQEKFSQGIGILALGYSLLILVGLSMGKTNPLQPLANASAPQSIASQAVSHAIDTVQTIEATITQAQGKPVMLDFYADWCVSCKVMEATTFKDKQVQDVLQKFAVIKIDVTANNSRVKAILNHFHVIAPPTFLFFNDEGEPLPALTLIGEHSAHDFLRVLKQVV